MEQHNDTATPLTGQQVPDTIRQAIDLFRHNDTDGNAGVITGLARQTGPDEYQKNKSVPNSGLWKQPVIASAAWRSGWGSGPRADFLGKPVDKN
jgi:hypothetical protein